MCNHYKPGDDPEAFEQALTEMLAKILDKAGMGEGFDAWPKRQAPVITQFPGERLIESMRWGVAVSIQGRTKFVTNARNDKLTGFPWRFSVGERRCLIPARGYYEPGTGPEGARGEIFFTVKNRPLFYIAGLWDTDPDEDGKPGARAFTMVTTEPNGVAARFHDRMPLVLSIDDARRWIGDKPLPLDEQLRLSRPPPDDWLQHVEIAGTPREKKITKADLRDEGPLLL